jgi:membrane peptidoglycan carboxypeptidase
MSFKRRFLRQHTDGGRWRVAGWFLGTSVVSGALVMGLMLPVVGSAAIAATKAADYYEKLPSQLPTVPPAAASVLLAADGTRIATFYDEDRIAVPLSSVSVIMRQAQVAIEDYRFYDHGGIDLKGTLRALAKNQSSGSQQGGSTLTQQYVKNVLIQLSDGDPDKIAAAHAPTIERKVQELRYAEELEKKLTKDQILANYLNIAYYGDNAYGVEAAARHYFSKPAADLTLSEAALLAGIVRSPTEYDPVIHPDAAKTRRDLVLTRMRDVGVISDAQLTAAQNSDLGLRLSAMHNGCTASSVPWFCDYVVHVFANSESFGSTEAERLDLLYRGGLTIRSTLDPQAQAAADQALADRTDPTDRAAAAMATVQPGTGRILAIAQSRPYGTGDGQTTVDYAVDHDYGGSNGFQDGSTNKAFTAAAAIDEGYGTEYKIDSPYSIGGLGSQTSCEGKKVPADGWHPSNDENKPDQYGPVITMREALRKSVNTYFAQLEEKVGLCETVQMAEAAGLHRADGSPLREYLPFTLGINEVSPLNVADSYATFAARGMHCDPIAIDAISRPDGSSLAPPAANCKQTIKPQVADVVTNLLQSVMDPGGTGQNATLNDGRQAAGKTGTTNGAVAVWYTGYTPQMSTSIWVGDPDSYGYRMNNITIGGTHYDQVCGACVAAPIWQSMMNGALRGRPVQKFHAADPSWLTGTQGEGDPGKAHVTYTYTAPGTTPKKSKKN